MNGKMIGILAVVVIAVVAVAAVVLINNGNDNGGDSPVSDDIKALTGLPNEGSRLWVYGNANEDDKIDNEDVKYLKNVISTGKELTVLCDSNNDGVINNDDVAYLQKIISAANDGTSKLDVYYVDNYNTVQKVSWPVNSIAIGYCSGVYTTEVTGLMDKVKMVDGTIKNKNWWKLNSNLEAAASFGSEESPDWEAILKEKVDVYVPGYCVLEPDKIARTQLAGVDVMFMNTCDNEGLPDYPNEYIDRSIVMFGYLLQGDMEKTYKYLSWHDEVLSKLKDAVKNFKESDKAHFIMSRSSPGQAVTATYSITGKDNTNNIHAEWVGIYSVGMHDTVFLTENYRDLTLEQIHTLLTNDSADTIYWMDNCHDGFRHTYDLDKSVAGWADALKDSGKTIHFMGMAREAGNSPLYVVELAFYQNVMYPELDTGLNYVDLFQYFVDNFVQQPEKYAGYDIGDFFKDFGVM